MCQMGTARLRLEYDRLSLKVLTVLAGQNIRWCTVSVQEMAKCKAMSEAFSDASIRPNLHCVSDTSVAGCAERLRVRDKSRKALSQDQHVLLRSHYQTMIREICLYSCNYVMLNSFYQ